MSARIAKIVPAAAAMFAAAVLNAQDDAVMKAMRDEMARSMSQLSIENLQKPYYIAYRVVDSETCNVNASFGALNNTGSSRSRRLSVEVRVGDYKFDNSGFLSFSFDGGTSMFMGLGGTELTLDDDYKEIRRQIWLATDGAYKRAVENYSKKKASLENKTRSDDTPDFSKETPTVTADIRPEVKIDRSQFESEARALSALFRQMPAIETSHVAFNADIIYTRYLNSEGTSYTRRLPNLSVNINAATQAPDGHALNDFVWYHGRSPADLPAEDKLAARARELGGYLTSLRDASILANYNGPMLAEGNAAAQLIRLDFLPNLVGMKTLASDLPNGMVPGGRGQATENAFLDKVGARVFPEFLSLTDNPLIAEYQGFKLAGMSKIDEDGVPSREVKLVENGYLKSLLVTRDPVRGFEQSTGSRHVGQASPTNLIVTSTNGLSNEDLRAKLVALVTQRHLEFGMIVRRLRNGNTPVLLYKAFPDGHEELVRNMQFSGMNAAAFKDIVATSKDLNALTVEYRPQQNNFLAFQMLPEANYWPVTIVAPSLLFEDVTLRRIRTAAPNPPVATHPFFDK
ncbi:MAG TPA: metallopeptidase TldD-related protein [Bryobacteraceae bacterium]|nr:metallopeptidase TldD-related protein [Bryobacteraceae bacterium]